MAALALVVGCGAAWAGEGLPPGFSISDYASVCAVDGIGIAPDGVIFAGNAGCGVGPGDPVWVRRIGVGGSPVENYGESVIDDPDAVAFDMEGMVSGVPGSVLVGSLIGANLGRISAILPSEEIVDLFGPVAGPENSLQMVMDGDRALVIDFSDGSVWEITSEGPALLIAGIGEGVRRGIAVGPGGDIYLSTMLGTIQVFDAAGGLIDDSFYEGEVALGGVLAFGPGNAFGEALYALNADGELVAIDEDGKGAVFATDFEGSHAAFGPDGAMYISVTSADVIRRLSGCAADCNDDGSLNVLDFVCFQGEWQDQTPLGDCDGNGLYNILDFVCFQGLLVGGCE
jgi:hypothetical protein